MEYIRNPNLKVSVVIATLGGDQLKEVINVLNKGSLVPDEILICIPKENFANPPCDLPNNVLIIPTKLRGQVSQRLAGFASAKNQLVFQMDDDVFLEKYCLEMLAQSMLNSIGRCSIAPFLQYMNTKLSIYEASLKNTLVSRIYFFLISGIFHPRAGSVLACGVGLGYPFNNRDELAPVEWLPGGCVMHHKENLVMNEYFPFSGKAYCEDLIHSHLLLNSNINLFVLTKAHAFIEQECLTNLNFNEFKSNLRGDYRARDYYLQLRKMPKYRMKIYYVLQILIFLLKKIRYISN